MTKSVILLYDFSMNNIQKDSIMVIPTDTIYGIVTSAWNKKNVERIYELKKRAPEKPCIILIRYADEMRDFGVEEKNIEKVKIYKTDRPTSFIVPITRTDLKYLDRGTKTLAFRIPQNKKLQKILNETGPLIAPSANTEGNPPATTIEEAREYFNDTVSVYIDGGKIIGEPSTLIDIESGKKLR